MSFISANVLAMTRSTQEPLPYISIWGARATNAALPGSCQTTTRSNATSFLFSHLPRGVSQLAPEETFAALKSDAWQGALAWQSQTR